MLCSVCKALPPLRDFNGAVEHHTVKTLESSVKGDCSLCKVIWHTLLGVNSFESIREDKDGEAGKAIVSLEYLSNLLNREICQYIWVNSDSFGNGGSKMTLYTKPNESAPDIIDGREVELDPAADRIFSMIQEYLLDCLSNHESCSSTQSTPLPSFVIDVGPSDGSRELRLIENDGALSGSYITLSYCWGGPQSLQLTKSTKEGLKRYIPLNDLPQTLKDAVMITRRLGQQYLWVDALCIIQDDREAQQKEISRMGQIYKNSLLTIQATSAKAVDQGFLRMRKSPSISPCKLVFSRDPQGKETYVYARLPTYTKVVGDEPTDSRAWIFQESVMASRLLVYAKDQVYFTCRQGVKREDGMWGGSYGGPTIGPRHYRNLRPDLFEQGRLSPSGMRDGTLAAWYMGISLFYTPRFITDGRDRLPAVSAFAQDAHLVIGGRYLAGIWEADVINGLLWRRHSTPVVKVWLGTPLKKSELYRAPSWSWAAYDGPILCQTQRERKLVNQSSVYNAKIIDISTTLSGPDMFGEVKDASLTIRGYMGLAVAGRLEYQGRSYSSIMLKTTDTQQPLCRATLDTKHQSTTLMCLLLNCRAGLLLDVTCSSNQEIQDVYTRIGHFAFASGFDLGVFEDWCKKCKVKTVSVV
ncbi:hypothetical protein G7Y89_g14689 [Cudoniella acicularis]|uniref:Heterokaryon incompatibility domain-containing protein n=1 Tax=Cudoniella acicularis TaxID=354080 RepID=A0A8H4QYT9_9HELO|nr:hypothetical protein G7Y89_g14689 [Cudoniella acicularis]